MSSGKSNTVAFHGIDYKNNPQALCGTLSASGLPHHTRLDMSCKSSFSLLVWCVYLAAGSCSRAELARRALVVCASWSSIVPTQGSYHHLLWYRGYPLGLGAFQASPAGVM